MYAGVFSLLIDITVIAAGASYALPIIPFFLFVVFLIQHFYLRTSRQLRLIELDSSKALVRHFTESGSGIEHLRAFKLQHDFTRQLHRMLDETQKPYYYLLAVQQWLASVMGLLTLSAATCVVSLALTYKKSTSPSAMGLAMLSLISFSDFTGYTVRFFVAMENTFGAVGRIKDFVRNTPSEQDDESCEDVPDQWPGSGQIHLNSVSTVYKYVLIPSLVTVTYHALTAAPHRPNSEKSHVALENITVAVQPGQTLGLVGRTGRFDLISGRMLKIAVTDQALQWQNVCAPSSTSFARVYGKHIRRWSRATDHPTPDTENAYNYTDSRRRHACSIRSFQH